MRRTLRILAFLVILLTGCTSTPSAKPLPTQSGLVGTWQLVRVGKQRVTTPHHIRYYADGTYAWWPAIEAKFSTKGITYGRYHLEGKFLVVEAVEGNLDSKDYMDIRGDKMIIIGGHESERNIYHRVVPDLEPGK
jgi:hypothetical protein